MGKKRGKKRMGKGKGKGRVRLEGLGERRKAGNGPERGKKGRRTGLGWGTLGGRSDELGLFRRSG